MARQHRGISAHHTAEVCHNEEYLTETVSEFMAEGYHSAEPLLLITTPARRNAVGERLSKAGISWTELERTGEATFCNGLDLLDRFMTDGMPNEAIFMSFVGEVLSQQHRGRSARTRCFGDMVDVLCARGDAGAALRLEELWNTLARTHPFTLLCGYIRGNLHREVNGLLPDLICGQHVAVRSAPRVEA